MILEDDQLYAIRENVVDAITTYIAFARPGTLDGDAGWAIKRITVSGTITTTEWANGSVRPNNIWNDRAGLTYL